MTGIVRTRPASAKRRPTPALVLKRTRRPCSCKPRPPIDDAAPIGPAVGGVPQLREPEEEGRRAPKSGSARAASLARKKPFLPSPGREKMQTPEIRPIRLADKGGGGWGVLCFGKVGGSCFPKMDERPFISRNNRGKFEGKSNVTSIPFVAEGATTRTGDHLLRRCDFTAIVG